MAPSCCIKLSLSTSAQRSIILPPAIRLMCISVIVSEFPLGGIPINGPWWVACHLRRSTTLSPQRSYPRPFGSCQGRRGGTWQKIVCSFGDLVEPPAGERRTPERGPHRGRRYPQSEKHPRRVRRSAGRRPCSLQASYSSLSSSLEPLTWCYTRSSGCHRAIVQCELPRIPQRV